VLNNRAITPNNVLHFSTFSRFLHPCTAVTINVIWKLTQDY
jgi:hypothetical protein